MPERVKPELGYIVRGQLLWMGLSALWNISGVVLVAQGLRAIGPTASLMVAAILLLAGSILFWAWRKLALLYALLSLLIVLAAGSAVLNAFTADPSLWPSEFWRLAGAALNGFGALCSAAAILLAIRSWLGK